LNNYNFAGREGLFEDGLIADIPGDEFPAFANVAFPTIDATIHPQVARNPDRTNDLTQPITWDVALSSESIYKMGVELSFIDGSELFFRCTVEDDGLFTLPITIQTALGRDDLDFYEINFAREAHYLLETDDATLVVTRFRESGTFTGN